MVIEPGTLVLFKFWTLGNWWDFSPFLVYQTSRNPVKHWPQKMKKKKKNKKRKKMCAFGDHNPEKSNFCGHLGWALFFFFSGLINANAIFQWSTGDGR